MKTEMYEVHKLSQQDVWWFKARKEIVHSVTDKYIQSKDNNILEVGAGYGIMTEMLKEYGTITAIEPYPEAAVYLKENIGVKTLCCTLEKIDSKRANSLDKYDIIAMFDVLEHIEIDWLAIAQCYQLLKEKGLLILTLPAYMFLWSQHDWDNNHYKRYTKHNIIDRLNFPTDRLGKQKIHISFTIKRLTYFNTLLFPLALLDKLWFARNKQSTALNPSPLVNSILYNIFRLEKILLKFFNLPFGVSILLIAEKRS